MASNPSSRVALVTGCGKALGIGRAITHALSRQGVTVVVSDVAIADDTLRFRVDQVGRPVLIRMSWYPTWKARGALGPYRVDPNFMVVVPQATEVRLFQSPGVPERGGQALTLVGVVGVLALAVADRRARCRA